MQSPLRFLPGARRLGALALAAVCAFALLPRLSAADDNARRQYQLPGEEAAKALKLFSEQSGRGVIVGADAITGVRTKSVAGEFTAREAIERMLAGTGLIAALDEKTGAFAIRRELDEKAVSKNAPSPVVDSASASGPILKMDSVEVTGSRIRTTLGEQGINPVLAFTRTEIEQSGVTNLTDLRALIPQLSVGNANSFDGNSTAGSPEGRLLYTLRGITGNNTLILVDGRRMTRTGQRVAASDNYELTGIPLSSVERVEVLLDGGSAIYGADAIGGVINIITRKNYAGSEIEFTYDNTFDKDAAKKGGSFNTSFRRGPLSLRASASYESQNALARRDRWWLASDDLRPLGGTDNRSTLYVGGVVRPVTGTLPGTNGATVLRIPANSNGRNLTIADFVAAGAPTDAERYDSGKTLNAINNSFRWSTSANAEYRFRPWLSAFANFSYSRYRTYANSGPLALSTSTSGNPALTSSLSANYPGNPFGVPINVQKYLWEQGGLDRRYQYDNQAASIGIRGDLPHEWRYEAGISLARSTPNTLDPVYQFSQPLLGAGTQSANPPILLNNSLTFGAANPPGTLEQYFVTGANQDIPESWTYDFKADGPVYQWWGGTIRAAVGAEMREEYVHFNRTVFAPTTEAAEPSGPRVVKSGFTELSVPLVGVDNRIPLVRELKLSVAARHDRYNDFGDATKPRFGASFHPTKWLMLRATRGEAFKVPSLSDINRPALTQTQNFVATGSSFILFDTARNENLLGAVAYTTGGNPSLMPEESVSKNMGVVLESPFAVLKGLSLSVDHWDISMSNRVTTVGIQDRFAFRPELFTRAAPTAADTAAGRPGRITAIDARSINIGLFRTAGNDFTLRYDRTTRTMGKFVFRATATDTTRYESVTRPGLAPLTSQSPLSRPLRGTAALDWQIVGLNAGLTATYQEGFRSSVTSAASETPATTLWDVRFTYDFTQGTLHRRDGWVGRWFKGVRVNLSILNALDLEPPLTSTGSTTGAVNSLGRRYTFAVRKAL